MFDVMPLRRGQQSAGSLAQGSHPLEQLHREFDALFDRFFGGWPLSYGSAGGDVTRGWGFDVSEGDKEITIRAEVPGFDPEDLDVQLNENVLTIKAEKQQTSNGGSQYGSYQRTIVLPPNIDADKVVASHRNGVLELHLPRTEAARGRRIAIQGQKPPTGGQPAQPGRTPAPTEKKA